MLSKIKKFNFCKFITNPEFTIAFQEFKTFRVMDQEGEPVSDLHKKVDPKLLNQIFDKMLMLDETDKILYSA